MNENTNERYPDKPYTTIVGQAACKMLYGTTEPPKEYEESGFSKRFKYNGGSYIYFFIPRTGEQLFLEEYSGEEENVSIPTGVTIIQSAVSSEDQFEEDLSSENSVKITPVFNMSNLKKITFPKTVLYIGENAIVDCQNLTEIDFSTSSPIIHNCAFKNCKNIEKVIMPSTQIKLEPDSMPFMGSTVRIFDFPNIGTLTSTEFNRTLKNGMNISPEGIGTIIMGIPLRGYPAATKVDSFIDLLLDKSMKGNDSNPCFSIFKGTSYLSEFDEEEQEKIIDYCDTILTKLLSQLSKEEIKKNVLSNINHKNFMHNIKVMMDAGFTEDDIANIIKENNFNLLNTNIENAFRNYEWLLSQKILTTEVMDKFFFNGEKVRDINSLKEYYDAKNKMFPELFETLLVDSQDKVALQDLKDKIIYISHMHWIDGEKNGPKKHLAKQCMKTNLFQNIVEQDGITMQRECEVNYNTSLTEDYNKKLLGIVHPLYCKMNGINPEWFYSFIDIAIPETPKFREFMASLETIKKWDSYSSEIERATDLKNEIVGRFLYADILLKYGKELAEGRKGKSNAEELVKKYCQISYNIPFEDLLKVASLSPDRLFNLTKNNSVDSKTQDLTELNITNLRLLEEEFKGKYTFSLKYDIPIDTNAPDFTEKKFPEIIETPNGKTYKLVFPSDVDLFIKCMLMIDPYSLVTIDGLSRKLVIKDSSNGEEKPLDKEQFAQLFGYYIEGDSKNSDRSIIESINNDIRFPIIQKQDKVEYISELRRLVGEYVKSIDDNDKLFSICNALDFYLRGASKQYSVDEKKGISFKEDSNLVFDRTIQNTPLSDMGRVLYCMFNLNRLAKKDYDWQAEKCDEFRKSPKRMNSFIQGINNLRDKIVFLVRKGMDLDKVKEKYTKDAEARNLNSNRYTFENFEKKDKKDVKDIVRSIIDTDDKKINLSEFVHASIDLITVQEIEDFIKIKKQQIIQAQSENDKKEIEKELENVLEILSPSNIKELDNILYEYRATINPDSLSLEEKVEIMQCYYGLNDFIAKNPAEKDFELLKTAIYEKVIAYECKQEMAKSAMIRFGILNSDKIVETAALNNDDKIKRFAELGFVVEVQEDEKINSDNGDNLVLACYCRGIMDAFSIHLKDLNLPQEEYDKLKQIAKDKKAKDGESKYLIAHTKIQNRLRVYGTESGVIDARECDERRVDFGFNSSMKEEQVQKANDAVLKNAITFGTGYMLKNFAEVMEERERAKKEAEMQVYQEVPNNNHKNITGTQSAESTEPKNIQNNNGSLTGLDDTDIRQQFEETAATLVDELETRKSEQQSTDYTSASINISKR